MGLGGEEQLWFDVAEGVHARQHDKHSCHAVGALSPPTLIEKQQGDDVCTPARQKREGRGATTFRRS